MKSDFQLPSDEGFAYEERLTIWQPSPRRKRFEVADMDHWGTNERFDAVVLNESLYYSAVDPREMFERTIGWLAEDGIVIASMFRDFGSRYIWSRVQSDEVEQLAACEMKDDTAGKVWDVEALRPRPANLKSQTGAAQLNP